MTVKDVIEKVDGLRRNNTFTIKDKMKWLNLCEAKIQIDCLLMPCVEVQYDYTADANEELIAKTPHDELYVYFVCAKIDEALGEMAMYNDTIAMYNDVHGDYQKWLIKTYDPKHNKIHLKRDHPVIFRGDKVTITVYGLPVEAGAITEAKALLTQGETVIEKNETTLEGDTMKFVLTARESYALSKGPLEIGYDITADGYRYKDEAACRFYVKLAPELQAIADSETGSPVDESLTIHGRAADAGVTGEKIQEVLSLVSQVQEAAAALGVDLQKMAVESNEYPGCWYRTVNGETEWLNPPLVPGIEYRTTERYNGAAVYVQDVLFTWAADTTLSFENITIQKYLRHSAIMGTSQLPFINAKDLTNAHTATMQVSKYQTYLRLFLSGGAGNDGTACHITVWYTKV